MKETKNYVCLPRFKNYPAQNMKRRKNSNAKLEVEGVSEDASSDEEKTFVIDTKGQTQIFRLKYLMILKRAIADIFRNKEEGPTRNLEIKGFTSNKR